MRKPATPEQIDRMDEQMESIIGPRPTQTNDTIWDELQEEAEEKAVQVNPNLNF